jgi:hypothetical protein
MKFLHICYASMKVRSAILAMYNIHLDSLLGVNVSL